MGLVGNGEVVLYGDAFIPKNSVEELNNQLRNHLKYHECLSKAETFLFKGNGPLSYTQRYYIAIMAAAQHQCSYLVDYYKEEFAMQGGDLQWLRGLHNIPEKLQLINKVNKILAHRPWQMEKSHIEMLTKGKDNWSLSEVVQAVVLLAHVHALSSFVLACGLHRSKSLTSIPRDARKSSLGCSQPVKYIISNSNSHASFLLTTSSLSIPPTVEEQDKAFASLLNMDPMSDDDDSENIPALTEEMRCFGCELPEKFRWRLNESSALRAQDFSWETHGYSMLNRFYGESGLWMDDCFRIATSLTYHTFGTKQSVDTDAFCQAVWNYVQCILGIRHDDYDYRQVANLLKDHLRAFLKATCCWPECLTSSDLYRALGEFHHSERVHVLILASEARMQVELLHSLHAIMKYIT